MSGLLPVAEAMARILDGAAPGPAVEVPLAGAAGRRLATDLAARRTQPPCDVSAMDGYAVRAADIAGPGARLRLIGESAAGHPFAGTLGAGDAVRIFTGARVPDGADTILIQENALAEGTRVIARQVELARRFVRPAGLDFAAGDVLLRAGTLLGPSQLALAAAMDHAILPVAPRPRVAILATGDELVLPGQDAGVDGVVASNGFGLAAQVAAAGGEPIDLGIAADSHAALAERIAAAQAAGADVLVTLGGASVGDHDLVQEALRRAGLALAFWKIAMRPGKPLMHGRLGPMRVLGLPGNPVSSLVCGTLFVQPLVRALGGDPAAAADPSRPARIGADMAANDERQDYVRATLALGDPYPVATPFRRQDSSMLRTLAEAGCLVVRPPDAPPARRGDACRIVPL